MYGSYNDEYFELVALGAVPENQAGQALVFSHYDNATLVLGAYQASPDLCFLLCRSTLECGSIVFEARASRFQCTLLASSGGSLVPTTSYTYSFALRSEPTSTTGLGGDLTTQEAPQTTGAPLQTTEDAIFNIPAPYGDAFNLDFYSVPGEDMGQGQVYVARNNASGVLAVLFEQDAAACFERCFARRHCEALVIEDAGFGGLLQCLLLRRPSAPTGTTRLSFSFHRVLEPTFPSTAEFTTDDDLLSTSESTAPSSSSTQTTSTPTNSTDGTATTTTGGKATSNSTTALSTSTSTSTSSAVPLPVQVPARFADFYRLAATGTQGDGQAFAGAFEASLQIGSSDRGVESCFLFCQSLSACRGLYFEPLTADTYTCLILSDASELVPAQRYSFSYRRRFDGTTTFATTDMDTSTSTSTAYSSSSTTSTATVTTTPFDLTIPASQSRHFEVAYRGGRSFDGLAFSSAFNTSQQSSLSDDMAGVELCLFACRVIASCVGVYVRGPGPEPVCKILTSVGEPVEDLTPSYSILRVRVSSTTALFNTSTSTSTSTSTEEVTSMTTTPGVTAPPTLPVDVSYQFLLDGNFNELASTEELQLTLIAAILAQLSQANIVGADDIEWSFAAGSILVTASGPSEVIRALRQLIASGNFLVMVNGMSLQAQPVPVNIEDSNSDSTAAAIAGGVVAGVVLVTLVLLLVYSSQRSKQKGSYTVDEASWQPGQIVSDVPTYDDYVPVYMDHQMPLIDAESRTASFRDPLLDQIPEAKHLPSTDPGAPQRSPERALGASPPRAHANDVVYAPSLERRPSNMAYDAVYNPSRRSSVPVTVPPPPASEPVEEVSGYETGAHARTSASSAGQAAHDTSLRRETRDLIDGVDSSPAPWIRGHGDTSFRRPLFDADPAASGQSGAQGTEASARPRESAIDLDYSGVNMSMPAPPPYQDPPDFGTSVELAPAEGDDAPLSQQPNRPSRTFSLMQHREFPSTEL
jgi:hypothetical protein